MALTGADPSPRKSAEITGERDPGVSPPSLSEIEAPEGLGARGRRLWVAHCEDVDGVKGLVLLEEACRTADRLDRLDRVLVGDTDIWFRLVHDLRTEDYEIKVDGVLVEARQQGAALRQLIGSLPLKESGDPDDGEGWLDQLPT